MKKIGSDTPASAMPIENRSKIEPRLSAETTPMAIPEISHMTAAPMASDNGHREAATICGQTGCWLRNE